jgi:hypothetical protein
VALLEEREKEQSIDLLKLQIKEYIRFIKKMIEDQNIMTKYFFIVVPYMPPVLNVKKAFGKKADKQKQVVENAKDFEEYRTQIERRMNVVMQGIASTGVRAYPLGTEELIEVFYKLFNPGDVEKPIPTI